MLKSKFVPLRMYAVQYAHELEFSDHCIATALARKHQDPIYMQFVPANPLTDPDSVDYCTVEFNKEDLAVTDEVLYWSYLNYWKITREQAVIYVCKDGQYWLEVLNEKMG